MNANKLQKYILKLKESFLEESEENRKMLDIYVKSIEGQTSKEEIKYADNQLKQIFKNLGLGILTVLPFSPITIPYVVKKAQEYGIDIIPNWYKKL
ncbi:hypothetical protein OAD25_02855 [Gammaproteobacteria bacterium]|jgi:hypothetical protein|nr:hypothetical protein [Gammaproteobacteria bacterium]MDB9898601.1 hypothetical protein [Gammaproteobacteria bacterium]